MAVVGSIGARKESMDDIPFTFLPEGVDTETMSPSETATFKLSCLPHRFIETSNQQTESLIMCNKPSNPSFLGRVIKRIDCRSVPSSQYLSLKRQVLSSHGARNKRSIEVNRFSHSGFKPRSDHGISARAEKRRKEETKRIRGERDDVIHSIFKCFETRQQYALKELSDLTKQPITFLKEIISDVCICTTKPPNKNMWELKQEYRHYSTDA